MKGGNKNIAHSDTEYTRTYSDIRGVDFSDPTGRKSRERLPYIENMYKDYLSGDGTLESVPGFRELFKLGAPIKGLFHQRVAAGEEFVIAHAGTGLYRFAVSERDASDSAKKIADVSDVRSSGISYAGAFYLFDGTYLTRVLDDGTTGHVGDEVAPYVPTRYENGVEKEQFNLLSDEFIETTYIDGRSEMTYGTQGLIFSLDPKSSTCAVIGVSGEAPANIFIPSRVLIADHYYDVTEIADLAFAGIMQTHAIYTSDGLIRIGSGAFKGCKNLSMVILSDTVTRIESAAFNGCETLGDIYLGDRISYIADDAFEGCTMMRKAYYGLAQDSLARVEGSEKLMEIAVYGVRYKSLSLSIPIKTPTKSIVEVRINGTPCFYLPRTKNGLIESVKVDFASKESSLGSVISIRARTADGTYCSDRFGRDVRVGYDPALFSNGAAIKGCTKAAVFDGRLFVSGNPAFPNTVFFSSADNPLFFGSLDYFNDGCGGYSVKNILPAQDNLIVFKSGDDGDGSIFYHRREELGGGVRAVRYPLSFANSGIYALGDATVFYDDPLFISRLGLCGLEKSSLGGVIAKCRSHNVNPKLLCENPENIRISEWQGYLALCTDGRIYLADSRRTFTHECGSREYEWFYLSGIGSPLKKSYKYRFHSIPFRSFEGVENRRVAVDSSTVMYELTNGELKVDRTYIALYNGRYHHAYRTEEMFDNGISPACEILGIGDLLFFGCQDGTLCIFNNDKRGVIPESLMITDPSIDAEEYAALRGRIIHPYFYSFAGYAPRYVIKIGPDNCDVPHLEKSTTPASLSIKFKGMSSNTRIYCDYDTNRERHVEDGGFCGGSLAFDLLSFDNLCFDSSSAPTVVCYDAPKRWVEKEITLSSDGYRSPFAIHSVTYRFKISGRIKKR